MNTIIGLKLFLLTIYFIIPFILLTISITLISIGSNNKRKNKNKSKANKLIWLGITFLIMLIVYLALVILDDIYD